MMIDACPDMEGPRWRLRLSWWIGRSHLLPGMDAETLEEILAHERVTNETEWGQMARTKFERIVGEVMKMLPVEEQKKKEEIERNVRWRGGR